MTVRDQFFQRHFVTSFCSVACSEVNIIIISCKMSILNVLKLSTYRFHSTFICLKLHQRLVKRDIQLEETSRSFCTPSTQNKSSKLVFQLPIYGFLSKIPYLKSPSKVIELVIQLETHSLNLECILYHTSHKCIIFTKIRPQKVSHQMNQFPMVDIFK